MWTGVFAVLGMERPCCDIFILHQRVGSELGVIAPLATRAMAVPPKCNLRWSRQGARGLRRQWRMLQQIHPVDRASTGRSSLAGAAVPSSAQRARALLR